jgi:hypothetical protein
MPTKPFNAIQTAAFELGYEGILNDPTDTDILIAAAELAGSTLNLYSIDRWTQECICAAFDRGYAAYLAA